MDFILTPKTGIGGYRLGAMIHCSFHAWAAAILREIAGCE
jgi:hypothetical protein